LDISVDGEHLDRGSRDSQPEEHPVDLGERPGQQSVVDRAGGVYHHDNLRDRASQARQDHPRHRPLPT
jgi:hypothetical protein